MRRCALFVAAALLLPQVASGHITMTTPENRYGTEQKTGPCGRANGERTDKVTVFEPGETITMVWDETVEHPSHYRISFDADGHDGFVDPAEMMEMYSNEAVLVDGIADENRGHYEYTVTLPEVECESCTLQLIQVMYDKPPYTVPGNDIYYNCADIALRVGGGGNDPDPMDPDPMDPGSMEPANVVSGCSTGGDPSPLVALLLALGLLAGRRRALAR